MHKTLVAIIAIGFRVGNGGALMTPKTRQLFSARIREAVKYCEATLNASIVGIADSGEFGNEPSEWFAISIPEYSEDFDCSPVDLLKEQLAYAAWDFEQESIALTLSETPTEFVTAEDWRDFPPRYENGWTP